MRKTMTTASRGKLIFVGDIGPSSQREDAGSIFSEVAERFRTADLVFAQLETNLTTRGARLPQAAYADKIPPAAASRFRDSGITVCSLAGNHCLDWGAEGLLDTRDALRAAGIQTVGGGANIAEARAAIITEVAGCKVGILARNSILPAGYWADERRAGCAPLRAFTIYEQIEPDQPGTPARIHTYTRKDDLGDLIEDVSALRKQCDFVVVSLHWGIHFVPATIADYQREAGHAVIDAGADMIVGHHPHILKGVELYRGRPIFYSLGNFAMDLPMTPELASSKSFRHLQTLHPDWQIGWDDMYNCPPDTQRTLALEVEVSGGRVTGLAVLPIYIDRKSAAPAVLPGANPRFNEVHAYVKEISASQALACDFTVDGDVLRIPGLTW
jgi:poly-gamma-glutamate synthesis protein (capsule biosynthesis protein)